MSARRPGQSLIHVVFGNNALNYTLKYSKVKNEICAKDRKNE